MIIGVCLEGLEKMLSLQDSLEGVDVLTLVESSGGLETIEQLQTHPNDVISKLASKIYDTYFSGERMMFDS